MSCNPSLGVSGDETGVSPEIIEACAELNLTNEQLHQFMEILLDNINRGLQRNSHSCAVVKCYPTYVQNLPNGTERGQFLALDLGGSNFRVLHIELGKVIVQKQSVHVIPQDVMVGSGNGLFDFVAKCLATYTQEIGVANLGLPLGFTFSFPLRQEGLTVGILETWTKGFNCPDVIGKDVVECLKEAIKRRGDVVIDVRAVMNDTTGTLVSAAYKNPDTKIGLILGTGTNACYVETQENAELFDDVNQGSGKVLINTEWGAFGSDGAIDFVRTDFDRTVDCHSINPGKQLFEKMISGMYLGELVRLAVEKFTNDGLMFGGQGSEKLSTRGLFKTKYVSEIEWDTPGSYTRVTRVCCKLDLTHATEQDYLDLKYICSCMSRRASHLVSAALAVLINKIGEKKISIGVDGTLFRLHPQVRPLMEQKIKELVSCVDFKLVQSEDGSGRGAALVAAVAPSRSVSC